jgi:FixJ family two-component response regulator
MDGDQTVFIVDDDRDFLNTACRWLESVDIPVLAFNSAAKFLKAFQPDQTGCLLLDIAMPRMNGLELLQELNRRHWLIPTIAMTAHKKVPYAVQAMKLGAVDFVEKPFRRKQVFIDLVTRVMKTAQYARRVRVEMVQFGERLSELTPREQDVLKLVVDGLSSNEIADVFNSTVSTVSSQRASVIKKLHVETTPELVRVTLRYVVATELDPTLASSSAFRLNKRPTAKKPLEVPIKNEPPKRSTRG